MIHTYKLGVRFPFLLLGLKVQGCQLPQIPVGYRSFLGSATVRPSHIHNLTKLFNHFKVLIMEVLVGLSISVSYYITGRRASYPPKGNYWLVIFSNQPKH